LKWEDLDIEEGFLSVRRSLEYTGPGQLNFKAPKTAHSIRRIDIPTELIVELVKHKGIQAENKLLLGSDYTSMDLVCCKPTGEPIRPGHISSKFGQLIRRLGMQHIRFHDLRHTHATWLLKIGVHPKVVQERLGHGTISITLDTYSHILPTMQKEAAGKIGTILQAALGNNR